MSNKGVKYQKANLDANLAGGAWVTLYLNDPTDTDIGDEALDYTRIQANFDPAVIEEGETFALNTNDVIFAGKPGGYGTITHVALKDAETEGDIIYYASLSEPIRSKDEKPIEFLMGTLKTSEK